MLTPAVSSGARGSSGSVRPRDGRSRSPGSRTPTGLEEDASQEPFDQRRSPLGPVESVVFDELATKAGLDDSHRVYALANCEVRSLCVWPSSLLLPFVIDLIFTFCYFPSHLVLSFVIDLSHLHMTSSLGSRGVSPHCDQCLSYQGQV